MDIINRIINVVSYNTHFKAIFTVLLSLLHFNATVACHCLDAHEL